MAAFYWSTALGLVAVTWLSFHYLALDLSQLFTIKEATRMTQYAASFFPPDLSADYLVRAARGMAETLAISAIGTALAALAGVFLALPAAGYFGAVVRAASKLVLNFLRAVPELVWAAIMVLAAGLGPFAGTLALAVHTAGVLGRLFAETLENTPREPQLALSDAGSPASAAFIYGTLPAAIPQFVAYALYRWEYNIRMAAVLGFVGAGGLGQMLYFSLSLFQQQQACTIILAMLVLVAIVDAVSAWLRKRLVL
ncbi:MAG: phosphonate ABC transporter, permease protein PhnE [Burkholderiales bacterium]|nr:phosphonate ABC transporter, permease protein PhnE [Burkholderiales bacterium]MDQ3195647.1 phosphonate ABC transporter, permease protein PhnE [Pseudomonadota bacterium]